MEGIKGTAKEIIEKRKIAEVEINKLTDDIDKMNKKIKESKEKALDKEAQKTQLNDETKKLRDGIEN